jgi:hypothetical protein
MRDENQGDAIAYTLWGDPVYRVGRKKGRPPFERTEENAHKISMLLACGWSNERIAGVVLDPRTGKPISVPTLKRYFRSELQVRDHARDMLRAKQLMAAADQAFKGNVGAQRLLDQLVAKNDATLQSAMPADRKPAARVQPKGKKEISADKAADAERRLREEAERARQH